MVLSACKLLQIYIKVCPPLFGCLARGLMLAGRNREALLREVVQRERAKATGTLAASTARAADTSPLTAVRPPLDRSTEVSGITMPPLGSPVAVAPTEATTIPASSLPDSARSLPGTIATRTLVSIDADAVDSWDPLGVATASNS